MATGLPVVAPAIPRIAALVEDGREGLLYDPSRPEGLPDALERLVDVNVRRQLGDAARRRAAPRVTAGRHTAKRWTQRVRGGHAREGPDRHRRVPSRLRRQRLEHVRAGAAACVRAGTPSASCARGRGPRRRSSETAYDGFRVLEFGAAAPPLPYVRNYFKNERLYPRLADFLASLIARERFDIVHGQHVLTCLPSIEAAARAHIPSVCTVRDYWPVCYWSDLIHTNDESSLCPACSAGMMTQCIRPRAGRGVAARSPDDSLHAAQPRTQAQRARARRRRDRRQHDASPPTCAHARRSWPRRVSGSFRTPWTLATCARAPRRQRAAARPALMRCTSASSRRTRAPSHLVDIVGARRADWPLVIAGDGPDRAAIAAAAARSTRDIRLIGWVDQDEATRLARARIDADLPVARARVAQPRADRGQRARACPIAAMNTGGTADIIVGRDDRPALRRAGGARRRRAAAAAERGARAAGSAQAARSRADALFDARGDRRDGSSGSTSSCWDAHRDATAPRRDRRALGVAAPRLGGLERHVYDLVRAPRRRGRRGHAHHAATPAAGRCRIEPARDPSGRDAAHRCRIARFRWPDAAARPCSIAARRIRCSASGPGAWRWNSCRRGAIDIVHGLGASVLGYARQRRTRRTAPLVLNPQGLEEFGATDPIARRLKRAAYLPLRRAVRVCARAADA